MYKFLCGCIFSSVGYIPGSRIAESSGNSTFNFLRNHQVLQGFELSLRYLCDVWGEGLEEGEGMSVTKRWVI